jgi:hypothetical protein
MRCGDGLRTGTSHDFRITRTAHSTHRQQLRNAWPLPGSGAATPPYHLTLACGPYADIPAEFRHCLFTRC